MEGEGVVKKYTRAYKERLSLQQLELQLEFLFLRKSHSLAKHTYHIW